MRVDYRGLRVGLDRGRVTALDQGQFHPLPADRISCRLWLGQAAAENLNRHVVGFAPVLNGSPVHGAQEVVGDVESYFHGDTCPVFQFSVKQPAHFVSPPIMVRIRSVQPLRSASISARGRGGWKT